MRFWKIRQGVAALSCILCLLFCAAQRYAQAQPATYISFEVPGALGTYPMSINKAMTVTGYYYVSSTVARGFLREANGAMTTFSVGNGLWTEPESINAAGDITGYYEVVPGVPHGFLRYADGRVVTSDPAENQLPGLQSLPVSINAFDDIAGNYQIPGVASNGFSRSRTGAFSTIGLGQNAGEKTVVTGLNQSGTVVGYLAGTNTLTAFYWHPDGTSGQFIVTVDQNNSEVVSQATVAESINLDGFIAGWFRACNTPCTTTSVAGFVRSPQGAFSLFYPSGTIVTLPAPGLPSGGETLSAPHRLSINIKGEIAGSIAEVDGTQHGLSRDPSGAMTAWDPDPPHGRQTTATSINDDGIITGTYYNDANPLTPVGFLRMP